MKKLLLALALCFTITAFADVCSPKRNINGNIARSTTQVTHFKKANACPSTGKIQKSCPGYQVDHVIPLCFCGTDTTDNMQWISIADHKVKTKIDLANCRSLKK